MRFQGILSAWDQDAGYGTIRALNGGDEVFVGLAAFPTDGEGPRLDELLSFEIVSGRDGRKRAANLKRLHVGKPAAVLRETSAGTRARLQQAQRKRRLTLLVGAVVAVLLVLGGVRWWQPHAGEAPATVSR
jgi:cold shock CspA family protein